MIRVARIEGYGQDPGEIRKELEITIDALWAIGICEGIAPREMAIKGEVYPRRDPDDKLMINGTEVPAEFDGRKIVEFGFITDWWHDGSQPRLQRDEEGAPDFVVFRRTPAGEMVEVTDAVVVVRRRNTDFFTKFPTVSDGVKYPEYPDGPSMEENPFERTQKHIKALDDADEAWVNTPPKFYGPGGSSAGLVTYSFNPGTGTIATSGTNG